MGWGRGWGTRRYSHPCLASAAGRWSCRSLTTPCTGRAQGGRGQGQRRRPNRLLGLLRWPWHRPPRLGRRSGKARGQGPCWTSGPHPYLCPCHSQRLRTCSRGPLLRLCGLPHSLLLKPCMRLGMGRQPALGSLAPLWPCRMLLMLGKGRGSGQGRPGVGLRLGWLACRGRPSLSCPGRCRHRPRGGSWTSSRAGPAAPPAAPPGVVRRSSSLQPCNKAHPRSMPCSCSYRH